MRTGDGTIVLKDVTMREGLDVPGVTLDLGQKRLLLKELAEAGIREAELVAPGHFDRDLDSLGKLGASEMGIRSSGLVYGHVANWREQVGRAKGLLDRVDILIPLSDARPPAGRAGKSGRMREALRAALDGHRDVGAGFPHAAQADPGFLLEMCQAAAAEGATRITLYDTNGSSDPWAVAGLVERVRGATETGICFHAHNDLGMATANAVAAARAGAICLDVTVNGLGDRAGNASLEQVALALRAQGLEHGLRLARLGHLSRMVEAMTRVPVSKLAPVVGEFAFRHKSPGHLASPELFEAFDPALVGASRSVCEE